MAVLPALRRNLAKGGLLPFRDRTGKDWSPLQSRHSPAIGFTARGGSVGLIGEARRRTYEWHHLAPARILIALPATPVRVTTDMAACSCISILARRVSGRVSVGLNAKLVVKATNK